MRQLREYIDLVERLQSDVDAADLDETAPPSKAAEHWIKRNKARFKSEYGKNWARVLYATAWKHYG